MRFVLMFLGGLSFLLGVIAGVSVAWQDMEQALIYAAWGIGGSILPFTLAEILRHLEDISECVRNQSGSP